MAVSELICERRCGERIPVKVVVGRPEQGEDGLWSCEVSLDGLYDRLAPMKSDDSFHALCLGIGLLRRLLSGVLAEGSRLLIPRTSPEQNWPIEAYFPVSGAEADGES